MILNNFIRIRKYKYKKKNKKYKKKNKKIGMYYKLYCDINYSTFL